MRSLKIIIFRDTDKPYTMIVPASVLIVIAFGIVALFSLLTYSVMGNVMLMSTQPDQSPAAGQAAAQGAPDRDAGEADNPGPGEAEQAGVSKPVESEPADATQPGERTGEDVPIEEINAINPQLRESWEAEDNPFEVEPLGGLTGSGSEAAIRIRVNVKEDFKDNDWKKGRLVVTLLDQQGQIRRTYPQRIETEAGLITNPGNGYLFQITSGNVYPATFAQTRAADYQACALYIFNEETKELLWKETYPLR